MDLIRIVCAALLPPRGVFPRVGTDAELRLDTLPIRRGYIPGIVHAVRVLTRR